MISIEQAIIRTLAYFDMFDYALSLSELRRYLWKYPVTSVAALQQAAAGMEQVEEHNGLYTLKDRGEIVELRNERYLQTERKFRMRFWIFWLLSLLPYVEAIFIVNSMAMHNAKDSSDIDLLIITQPGHIWTARFATTVVAKLLGVRPKPNYTKDTVCLSFYMDTSVLAMEEMIDGEDDVYQLYWLRQLVPVYDPNQVWKTIAEQNSWLTAYLPNAEPVRPHPDRWITHSFLHTILHATAELFGKIVPLESLFKKAQYSIMPNELKELSKADHNRVVVLSDSMLKLHTHDPRPAWRKRWQAVTEKIGQS